MAFKINFSEQAADDLDKIVKYIREELSNPQAARRFYEAVDEKLRLLREHPYMFPSYHDEKLSAEGFRSAVIGNFMMFYLVDDGMSLVSIARILYGKRDIPTVWGIPSPDADN
ncbi:MAG: type II toxin-antitoxin system RelE/ParE family toxin [Peptococcaceae bacterium]|jgi:addiction module RelE/StbE family toxin|nr:type II toxin-antitoxin system RelE/ParE family toxin [Peptococcaceae bacterium]